MKIILFFFTLMLSTNIYANVGKVTALSGAASIERAQQTIKVTIGTLIQEKDTIKTTNNSRLQMIFDDKTVITLGKNTVFSVQEYLFNNTQESTANFSLTKGFLKSVTGKIGKVAPQRFKVKTKTSTIGIRGTIFTVESNERFTRLTTLSGATFFQDNKTGKVYDIPKNRQLTFNQADQKVEVIEVNEDPGEISSSIPAEYYETSSTVSDAEQTEQTDATNTLIEDSNSDSTNTDDTSVQKVVQGTGTYARYGYWERVVDQQMTDPFAEAVPGQDVTSPIVIETAMASAVQASYTGEIIAFDMPKNKGVGSINMNVVFNASPAVTGSMTYSIDGTRWNNSITGTVNPMTGFNIDSFSPLGGSDVIETVGTMTGNFYGSNAEEVAGTFYLRGTHAVTGIEKHSTGSFLGVGTGIAP